MAARELRAAPRRLLLLMGTVAVGVAALVAINSFTDNLQDSVRQQARALLGADLALVEPASLLPPGGSAAGYPVSRSAAVAHDQLCRHGVRAPDRRHPSGSGSGGRGTVPLLRRDPDRAAARPGAELQSGRHVVVDPSLLTALSARIGDTIALGEGRFVITGTIESAPSDAGVRFAFGPRIYIPARYLEETGLLGFGARVEHEAFLKLPANVSAQALADRYRACICGPSGSGFAPSPTTSAISTTFSPSSPAISDWSP